MSIFGTPGFSTSNPPPAPFGATPARSAFAAPAATPAPSIFGTAGFATPAAAPAATSIFGAAPSPFGATTPGFLGAASAYPSLGTGAYGSNPLGTGGLPGFGAAPAPAFGASAPGYLFANSGAAAAAQPTDQIMTPAQSVAAIELAVNPAPQNRYYRFRYMFYNVLPPNTTPEQVKMPANVDPSLWEQARKDNPDPRRLVPVQANGFADLKIRVDEQDKMAAQQVKALEDMQKFVRSVEQRQEVDTRVKLEDAKRRHQDLQLRLLRVLRKVEVLQAKGAGLQPEEERWKSKLQQMQRDLNSPTQYKARVNELASLARIQEDSLAAPELVGGQELDDASLETVHKFLEEQQQGLFQLTEIIKKDTRDLQALTDTLGKPAGQQPMQS